MLLIKRVKINLLCSFVFDQQIFTMLEKQAVAKANSSPWINFQKNNNCTLYSARNLEMAIHFSL